MRLTCDVDLLNHSVQSHNLQQKRKTTKSQLSVGRKPGCKKGPIYVLVCNKQDRNGHQFLLEKNVSQCFTKFVSEGKATIRITEPAYDICLSKANPIELKAFLSVIKMCAQCKNTEGISFSCLGPASTSQLQKLKRTLNICKRKDYPITSGFPTSLETLKIQNCSLKRIDSRILLLRRLTILDLSNNALSEICSDWSTCETLKEVNFSNNFIETIPSGFCSGVLSKSLYALDVSDNKLSSLRPYFCDLKTLSTLKLDNNPLRYLPLNFGNLNNLRNLAIANNKLQTLPATFRHLRLKHLQIYGNEFLNVSSSAIINRLEFPTLLELTGRYIFKKRLPFNEEDVGNVLYEYLNTVKYCLCGSPCFRNHVHYLTEIRLNMVSSSVTASNATGLSSAPSEAFLCSQTCLQKYQTNPNATIWHW